MKKLVTLFMVMVMALSIAACGNESNSTVDSKSDDKSNSTTKKEETKKEKNEATKTDEEVTLRLAWLGEGANKENLDASFAKFTEKTGVKVEIVFIAGDWQEYFTKIQTMVAGGETIDNAYVAIEGFQMFRDMGLAQPVTDFVTANQEETTEILRDISPGILKSFYMEDELYGFPTSFNNVVMHCNKNRFAKAGVEIPSKDWNKEDFLAICEKLTTEKDGVKQYAVAIPEGYFMQEAWLRNNGTSFISEDLSKSLLNAPETVEIFQLWQDLVHKYGYAPIPEPNVNNIQQLVDGNVAMGAWGRWPMFTYQNNEFKDVALQFLPSFEKNQVQYGVDGLFVSANTKHYNEACQLAMFASSESFIRDYFTIGNIPASQRLAEELVPIPEYPDNYEIFYNNNDDAQPVSSPVGYAEIAGIVANAVSAIVVNNEDVQTVLDTAHEEVTEILEQ